jgi:hypothetical protein
MSNDIPDILFRRELVMYLVVSHFYYRGVVY